VGSSAWRFLAPAADAEHTSAGPESAGSWRNREDEARRLLADAEALDWDQVTADEMNKGLVPDTWKSGWRFKPGSWLPEGGNATQADDARTTRTLSNGALIVHPRLSAEKDYVAAVEAADATPDAKADAIARYPQIRKAQAQQTLETIQEIQSTLGPSALSDWENYSDWVKKRPADVDEAEWALRWTERNKAQNTGPLGTLLSKTKQFLGGIAAGGNDLRQQTSGLLAGITGSEALMQDAQWAGRKAEAQTARLELGGHTSGNFLTKGIFDIKSHSFLLVAGTYQLNFEVHVAVAGPTVKPLEQVVRGTLPRISLEELVHALLWALDDVLADPRLSEDDKRGWVSRIRNVMYVFHKLSDHKEIIKQSINIREEMTTVFKSIMRTPLALFMMIVAQKKELEKEKEKSRRTSSARSTMGASSPRLRAISQKQNHALECLCL
jgi:hypothetical protein